MKKIFKKILFPCCVLLVMVFCMPCFYVVKEASASNYRGDYISICYKGNIDGTIEWSLDFGLNTESRGLAEDEKQLYRTKQTLMLMNVWTDMQTDFQTKYNNAILNAENEEETALIESFYLKDNRHFLKNPIYDQQADYVGFTFKFASYNEYHFYMGKSTDILTTTKNIFYTHQVKENVFPFAEFFEKEGKNVRLAEYYRSLYISACDGLSIETQMQSYEPQFIYDYAIASNRVKSNADIKYTDAVGFSHHAWGGILSDINADMVMTLTLTVPKRGWWYVFGVVVPLVAMFVAIVIIKIKQSSAKKKQKQVKEEGENKTA